MYRTPCDKEEKVLIIALSHSINLSRFISLISRKTHLSFLLRNLTSIFDNNRNNDRVVWKMGCLFGVTFEHATKFNCQYFVGTYCNFRSNWVLFLL